MIGGGRHVCLCLRTCFWECARGGLPAHTLTHSHAPAEVHMCLSASGNLSALLSISGTGAQWDINCNMQLNHLCKSQYRGGITFLIKFPWLIVIKVSSVNVSSWLSNSGAGDSKHIPGDWGEGCVRVCVCVRGGHTDTQIAPGHTGSLRTTDSYEIQLSVWSA